LLDWLVTEFCFLTGIATTMRSRDIEPLPDRFPALGSVGYAGGGRRPRQVGFSFLSRASLWRAATSARRNTAVCSFYNLETASIR